MKQPKKSLQLPKPTRNTYKIGNKLIPVASGKINLQIKQDFICHVVEVKAAMLLHSMGEAVPFQ